LVILRVVVKGLEGRIGMFTLGIVRGILADVLENIGFEELLVGYEWDDALGHMRRGVDDVMQHLPFGPSDIVTATCQSHTDTFM
jgi:hypothetical protein